MKEGEHTVPPSSEGERVRIRLELSRQIHVCDRLKPLIHAERIRLIDEMIEYGFVNFD